MTYPSALRPRIFFVIVYMSSAGGFVFFSLISSGSLYTFKASSRPSYFSTLCLLSPKAKKCLERHLTIDNGTTVRRCAYLDFCSPTYIPPVSLKLYLEFKRRCVLNTIHSFNFYSWLSGAFGFIITKADIFPIAASRGAGQIVLNVTLPCLMFSKIVPAFTPQNIDNLGEHAQIIA